MLLQRHHDRGLAVLSSTGNGRGARDETSRTQGSTPEQRALPRPVERQSNRFGYRLRVSGLRVTGKQRGKRCEQDDREELEFLIHGGAIRVGGRC